METKQRALISFFACATALLLLGLSSLPAIAADSTSCLRNPVMFVFGDSNSDTGGFAVAHGLAFGYPYGRLFPEPSDRFSDGRLIIDFLCESVKARYLSSYLDSFTANHRNGVNFAVGGSATLPTDTLLFLTNQLHHFNRFRPTKSMLGEEDFQNALYVIDIGHNDIVKAFSIHTQPQPSAYISEIREAISGIYREGGRNFWVHSTGPLGCLPDSFVRIQHLANDVDEHGCIRPVNEAAKEFNSKLSALCEELRQQLTNATVIFVDIYSIKYGLIADPSPYGFENPLMACCEGGGPPHNVNVTCGQSGYDVCAQGDNYISWDGIHYTDAANAIVAHKILSTNYSTPPLKFGYFCSNN